jgi:hypothetical protein
MKAAWISHATKTLITKAYAQLDYETLGQVYCWEGGDEFWDRKRKPCQRLGIQVAEALLQRLPHGGRSLYVGAGVAEVAVLNRVCRGLPVRFRNRDAASAKGSFDHLWMVSVLNDPERFPHVSSLSYGRADPVTFDPMRFQKERQMVQSIVDRCLPKLTVPGLVTTSIEEVVWIADWCHRHGVPYRVERKAYRTALVGDPVCFIRFGRGKVKSWKVRKS